MSLCGGLTDPTAYQVRERERLEDLGRRLMAHMTTRFPNEATWGTVQRVWSNQQIQLSNDLNIAAFDIESGCFVIGIPRQSGMQDPSIINARFLLGISKGASRHKRCSTLHSLLLREATEQLGIQVALDCTLSQSAGLNAINTCEKCRWIGGAPVACHTRRMVWPEFLGWNVYDVARQFRDGGITVQLATWDTLHYKPAASNVVRLTYDARTGLIVSPPPHIGNVNIPEDAAEWNCFSQPDDASRMRCIGAPLSPPPEEWKRYVGYSVMDVVDSLRTRYVHATVEYIPNTAAVGPEMRPDRIRVRFDPNSGQVTSVPTIG